MVVMQRQVSLRRKAWSMKLTCQVSTKLSSSKATDFACINTETNEGQGHVFHAACISLCSARVLHSARVSCRRCATFVKVFWRAFCSGWVGGNPFGSRSRSSISPPARPWRRANPVRQNPVCFQREVGRSSAGVWSDLSSSWCKKASDTRTTPAARALTKIETAELEAGEQSIPRTTTFKMTMLKHLQG